MDSIQYTLQQNKKGISGLFQRVKVKSIAPRLGKATFTTLTIAFLTVASTGAIAKADCLTRIKTLYANELDAYKRPSYRSLRLHLDEAGKKKAGSDNIVETPLRTISYVHGSVATLVLDEKIWNGETINGPWQKAPHNFPKNRRALHEHNQAAYIKNLTDAKCNGKVKHAGKTYLHFHFATKTDPLKDQGGKYIGASHDVYLDPKTKLVMIWEKTNFISSYSKTPSKEKTIETFTYDNTIKITEPH